MGHKIPRFSKCIVAGILLFCASSQGADEKPADAPGRKLTVRVVDPEASPVQGATVELFGIERYSHHPEGLWENPPTPKVDGTWVFETDKNGECTVQFWKDENPKTGDAGERDRPGFGEYYFVVTKALFAGGVSRRVDYSQTGWEDDWKPAEWKNARRPSMNLAGWSAGRPLTITLSPGITIHGHVEDTNGKGLGRRAIIIYYDLHIGSHTGYGGEFWSQKATTDSSGDFRFDAVYPARFYLAVEGHWAGTLIDKKWVDGPVDHVDPVPGQNLNMVLVLADKPLHRYGGRIVDEAGKPIPNLRLAIGLSQHWPPESFADEHHFENVTTDADGRYALETDAPFVRYVLPELGSGYKGPEVDDVHPVKKFDLKFSKQK